MTLLDRLHSLAARIGISPKVLDPIVVGVVAVVASWIISGDLNTAELRYLAALALYALIGFAAPPSAGEIKQAEVEQIAAARALR